MLPRRTVALAATATALAVGGAAATPAAASPGTTSRAAAKASVVATKQIDSRLLELTVSTPALASHTKARILLPAGYSGPGRRRYPVLYLLHGAGDDYRGWTRSGDLANVTAGQPLIVVMPDGGRGGWYSNWHNEGRGGPPAWESYHIDQLVPLIDRRFRTVADHRGRAIAGLSMGGFGAFSYAARHPDLFTAAASFSGGLDLNLQLYGQPAGQITVAATAVRDGGNADSVFGDFVTENIRWRGHNPPDLAANLRGLALALHGGNGQPGGPFGGSTFDLIEFGAHEMSVHVHDRLRQLRIPHIWDDHGPGSHTWPYWARDLRETLPSMMQRFAHPVAAAKRITYTSTERSYGSYGWRVAWRRPNVEFSTLSRARARGFELSGSGRATVTTPAQYRPRTRFGIRITRAGIATTRRVTSDRRGRLRIAIRVAPVNRHDQDSPAAKADGPWHRATAKVQIARLR